MFSYFNFKPWRKAGSLMIMLMVGVWASGEAAAMND